LIDFMRPFSGASNAMLVFTFGKQLAVGEAASRCDPIQPCGGRDR
jgi:hypothetical protein